MWSWQKGLPLILYAIRSARYFKVRHTTFCAANYTSKSPCSLQLNEAASRVHAPNSPSSAPYITRDVTMQRRQQSLHQIVYSSAPFQSKNPISPAQPPSPNTLNQKTPPLPPTSPSAPSYLSPGPPSNKGLAGEGGVGREIEGRRSGGRGGELRGK